MAPTLSKVLKDDSLIHKVCESIDAVTLYGRLGLALLGNKAAVTSMLGKPIPHFEEGMYKCLCTWRDAQVRGREQELMSIFKEFQLNAALALLKEGMREDENPNCLSNDVFLYELARKIDCLANYTALGTRLLGSAKDAQCIIGLTTPSYTEALFNCMIRWRDANGESTEDYTKLKDILISHGLEEQAALMDKLERGQVDAIYPEPGAYL